MGLWILTTSLYSCCSVFSQAGAPSVFPPITFPLGHGGHGRQQPQHPQLNVLEQDGEFKGRLSVAALPCRCMSWPPSACLPLWVINQYGIVCATISSSSLKEIHIVTFLKSALTLPSGHPAHPPKCLQRETTVSSLIGRSNTITAHTNSGS